MTTIPVLDATGLTVALEKPLAPGRSADATSRPVALSNEDVAILGIVTEPAPASDTASSGLNGRMQRIAQNISALIALLPTALGGNGGLKISLPDTRPASGAITVQDTVSATATGQNSVSIVTGAPTAASFYTQAINGQSTARVQVTGTWTGTLTFEGSPDGGTTWVPQTARVTGTSFSQSSVTANGIFTVDVAGLTNFRARATAAITGTATVQAAFSVEAGFVQITNPLRLVDNVSGAHATIKAASTAPATTDTTAVTGIADGNHVTFGLKADAKNSATDTTSITAMSVWKQISASVQLMVFGAGTAAAAQRATLASDDPAVTALGATADAAVTAGATGSISAKLRSISRDIVANIVLAAGTNLIGRAVADASAATGGIQTTARLASAAASTNALRVKATAGRVYQASGKNNAAYDVFLVLYDSATSPPVPGTTTIRKKIPCPAAQAFVYDWPLGLEFATGIGYAFTKLVADADTTVLVAADITAFNLDYV